MNEIARGLAIAVDDEWLVIQDCRDTLRDESRIAALGGLPFPVAVEIAQSRDCESKPFGITLRQQFVSMLCDCIDGIRIGNVRLCLHIRFGKTVYGTTRGVDDSLCTRSGSRLNDIRKTPHIGIDGLGG